jgi:hypothetical protein
MEENSLKIFDDVSWKIFSSIWFVEEHFAIKNYLSVVFLFILHLSQKIYAFILIHTWIDIQLTIPSVYHKHIIQYFT